MDIFYKTLDLFYKKMDINDDSDTNIIEKIIKKEKTTKTYYEKIKILQTKTHPLSFFIFLW
jgi:hypothetical protein